MARLEICMECGKEPDNFLHKTTAEECTKMGENPCQRPEEHHLYSPVYHCPTCGQHVNR